MKQITKKKSAYTKKNEGDDLFFRVLSNILSTKSQDMFNAHINEPTFDGVYNIVSVEKAMAKCYDINVVKKMITVQPFTIHFTDKRGHYLYLMNVIPKTKSTINWKLPN